MRDVGVRPHARPRGSVPSVRPAEAPMGAPSGFQNQAAQPNAPYPQELASRGGSFLGTAAAAAAGVIGGALLLDGIRSMFGHGGGPFGAVDQRLCAATRNRRGATRPAAPPTAISRGRPGSTTSAARRARRFGRRRQRGSDCSTIPTMIPATPIRSFDQDRRRRLRRRWRAIEGRRRRGGRLASSAPRSDHDDLGADLDAAVEVDDVLVAHADAAGRHRVPIVQGSFEPWMR